MTKDINKSVQDLRDDYFSLDKSVQNEINNFIQDVLISKKKLSCNTIGDYIRSLKCFNQFIKEHDLELNEKTVYDFFLLIRDEEHNFSDYKMYYMKCHLKSFLAYLYKTQKTDNDLSKCVPDIKYKRNRPLPSVFTNDEIKKIIDQIDRNSIHGKRAYAMIILATRYGLRSGDVVNLKFENIDWEKNIISIEQKKTKCAIELPLLPEVGNAILDYLKHGRRESNLPYVFLNIKGPVTSITNGAFYNTLKYYINLAGIENLSKRKHGPHALRHSLASEMMNNGEELTTISAVLGHRSTQITTVYLSIDYENLKKCAVPMPKITSPIYLNREQKWY